MNAEYGNRVAKVRSAAGITGVLCRDAKGGYFFRVRRADGTDVAYDLRHSDLQVTIHAGEEAAFYDLGDARVLDHTAATLGLKIIE